MTDWFQHVLGEVEVVDPSAENFGQRGIILMVESYGASTHLIVGFTARGPDIEYGPSQLELVKPRPRWLAYLIGDRHYPVLDRYRIVTVNGEPHRYLDAVDMGYIKGPKERQ